MTPMPFLTEALSRGGRLLWDQPNSPRLMVPATLRGKVEAERDTVREVIRRATIFREQALGFIEHQQPLPILALPEHPGAGGCVSCGAAVGPAHHRCAVCALAVRLALEGTP